MLGDSVKVGDTRDEFVIVRVRRVLLGDGPDFVALDSKEMVSEMLSVMLSLVLIVGVPVDVADRSSEIICETDFVADPNELETVIVAVEDLDPLRAILDVDLVGACNAVKVRVMACVEPDCD